MTGPGDAARVGSQTAGAGRWVRSLREAKRPPDPNAAIGTLIEKERAGGRKVRSVTVFLAGAECPFSCVFCDLWQHTLEGPTPPGVLPRQLDAVLREAGEPPPGARLKLYNASNFFDPRAVPEEDLGALAGLCAGYERVVAECHPAFLGPGVTRFHEALGGCLEVAIGLETIHPRALPRLNKAMSRDDFDRALEFLDASGIPVRAFVLVGAPYVPESEREHWPVLSAAYAFEHGVETVSLIPVRGGNGALERLAEGGEFRAPDLAEVERVFGRALGLTGGTVLLDTWDLASFGRCPSCSEARLARLMEAAESGAAEVLDGAPCPDCPSGPAAGQPPAQPHG